MLEKKFDEYSAIKGHESDNLTMSEFFNEESFGFERRSKRSDNVLIGDSPNTVKGGGGSSSRGGANTGRMITSNKDLNKIPTKAL